MVEEHRMLNNEPSTISSELIIEATRAITVTYLEARTSVCFDNEGELNTGTRYLSLLHFFLYFGRCVHCQSTFRSDTHLSAGGLGQDMSTPTRL